MKYIHLTTTAALFFVACSSSLALSIIPEQYSSPGIYRNLLIFSERTGSELYAVDITTKQDAWVWTCGKRSIRTQPTILEGIAYIWAGNEMRNSRACAVNCETGESVWETPAGGWTFSPAVVVQDAVLFSVAAHTHEIWAFNRKTGKLLWLQKGFRFLLAHGNTVLATRDADTQLALLNIRTGEPFFETPLVKEKYNETQAQCKADGTAVIGCYGMLLSLSIPNRKVLWQKETPNERWVPAIQGEDIFLLRGYPTKPETPQRLRVCSLSDGVVRLETDLEAGEHTHFPAQVFDKVALVASGGALLGVDRKTLKEVWRLDTGSVYQVSKDNHTVYVGGAGPYLWQVDSGTGKKLWVYEDRRRKKVATD